LNACCSEFIHLASNCEVLIININDVINNISAKSICTTNKKGKVDLTIIVSPIISLQNNCICQNNTKYPNCTNTLISDVSLKSYNIFRAVKRRKKNYTLSAQLSYFSSNYCDNCCVINEKLLLKIFSALTVSQLCNFSSLCLTTHLPERALKIL